VSPAGQHGRHRLHHLPRPGHDADALLLHYANIAIGLGLLAAPALVRGRRGRLASPIGALLAVIGFMNVSGQILSDWWNMSAALIMQTGPIMPRHDRTGLHDQRERGRPKGAGR
jgi:hypothetical protein